MNLTPHHIGRFTHARAVAILALLGIIGCSKTPEPVAQAPKESPSPAPKSEPAPAAREPSKGSVPSFSEAQERIAEAKRNTALLGCKSISIAVDAYRLSPSNPDGSLPSAPTDLVNPPFGGPSFLRNGQKDLLDPWGNPYQFKLQTRKDGVEVVLISTTAPDGTPISQHGIGEKATPPN